MSIMDTAKIIETGEFSYSMCIGSVKRALDERYRLSKRKETLTKELLEFPMKIRRKRLTILQVW